MRVATVAAAIAVLAVLIVGGIGAQRWANATDDNCERIHRVVKVGAEVIAATREMAKQDYREQIITLKQRDRTLERIDAQLERWNSADCVP
jgi:hypothetical protein